jgi:hypothetical protein
MLEEQIKLIAVVALIFISLLVAIAYVVTL